MARPRRHRFLFVSAPFSGIEVFFNNLRCEVERHADVDATWVRLDHDLSDWSARLPVIRGNWTLKGGLAAFSRIRALEGNGARFDAAFFNHTCLPGIVHFTGWRVPRVLSLDATPLQLEEFRPYFKSPADPWQRVPSPLKTLVTRRVYAGAAALLPWSEPVRRSLTEQYGVPRERMQILPPGIDLHRWIPSARDRSPADPVRILFVGRQFRRKGGDLLLGLAGREGFAGCEFHLVSAESPACDMRQVVLHRDLSPNDARLVALYSSCDIFVLPTRADFAPTNVVLEAMASGLPVVTTAVGGLETVVENGVSGYVVPPGDAEALEGRLQELVRDPVRRARFGAHGRRIAEERFDLRRTTEEILLQMRRAAGGPG